MEKFYWGCSTSSAQIEGAFDEDGKGRTIWDAFCDTKGFIKDGTNNRIADDSYHKYKEDIKLLKELGCNSYRFSISWARIIPDGCGKINERGLQYYSNVIDECLKNGIEPFVTLYHWDMPLNLYNNGSFFNPEFLNWFSNYCEVVVSRFCDRVKHWFVINEPTCIIGGLGGMVPFKIYPTLDMLKAAHVLNLCSAKGFEIIHKHGGIAGCAYCGPLFVPAHDDNKIEYKEACRRTLILKRDDLNIFSVFISPAVEGKYPDQLFKEYTNEELCFMKKEDFLLMKENKADFIGLNVYMASTLTYENGEFIVDKNVDSYRTSMDWPVYNKCLYWAVKIIQDSYKKPIFISENGIAVDDKDDCMRSKYITEHIDYLMKAKQEGVNVVGYFYWSLLDNFEWFQGLRPKFGIVRSDRSVKDSYYTYKNIIEKYNKII